MFIISSSEILLKTIPLHFAQYFWNTGTIKNMKTIPVLMQVKYCVRVPLTQQ